MKLNRIFAAALTMASLSAVPAFADGMALKDAYVRSSTPSSVTGAAFFMLMNESGQDDTLIAATSDVAKKVELHTHTQDDNGVMKMSEIEGGVQIAAGEMHAFQRGGDHIMFMGLAAPLKQGDTVDVVLTFEKAGDIAVQIPVDHNRKPDHGAMKHD